MNKYQTNPCEGCGGTTFSSVNQGKHEQCRKCGEYRR